MPPRQVTPVAHLHGANRLLTTFGSRAKVLAAIAALLVTGATSARADSFADPTATTAWGTSRWNNTADALPFNTNYTALNNVTFTSGNNYSFAGMGATVNVGNVTLQDNSNVTFSIAGSTYATGGAVRTFTVGTNSTLDFITQSFSTAAGTGFIKSGPGALELAGGAYTGGFTLNAGTVVIKGINAMGGGATNALTINGGVLAANANRDMTGKYGAGITIGGDFQLGEVPANVAAASATANLTFSNNMALGGATRTITLGNSGLNTLSGVLSGTSGTGLIVAANANGTTGTLALSGANTYDGGTTVSGGTLLANNGSGSAAGSGGITVNGGTFGGNGIVTGSVTVNSTGNVSPGGATATQINSLYTGALTLNSGSTSVFQMNSSGSLSVGADLINANGALNLATTGALLSISDSGNTLLPVNTKFTLISYSGSWNGNAFNGYADDSTITVGANQFVLNYNDTSAGSRNFGGGAYTNAVTLTAVPEAGSFILGALVCLAVGIVIGGKRNFRSQAVEA